MPSLLPGRVSPTTAKSSFETVPPWGPTVPVGGTPVLPPVLPPVLLPPPVVPLPPVVPEEPPQLQIPPLPLQGSDEVHLPVS